MIRTRAVLVVVEPSEIFIGFNGSTVQTKGMSVGVGVGVRVAVGVGVLVAVGVGVLVGVGIGVCVAIGTGVLVGPTTVIVDVSEVVPINKDQCATDDKLTFPAWVFAVAPTENAAAESV